MVFTLFAICITVAEVAVGLALVILLFRTRRTAIADHLSTCSRDDDQPVCRSRSSPGCCRPWRSCVLSLVSPLRRSGAPAALRLDRWRGRRAWSPRRCWPGASAASSPNRETVLWAWLPDAGAPLASLRRAGRRAVGVDAASWSRSWRSLVQVYSLGYMTDETPGSLGPLLHLPVPVRLRDAGAGRSHNTLQTFVFWELVGLGSYLLIGFWYRKPEAARAAVKAFWTTRLGDVGLLIGIVLLWSAGGTFVFAELFEQARAGRAAAAQACRRHRVLPVPRRDGQERAVPAAHLAAGRDGRPDAGLGADPRGDDGRRGRLPDGAHLAAVRPHARRAADRGAGSAPSPRSWRPCWRWCPTTSSASWPSPRSASWAT